MRLAATIGELNRLAPPRLAWPGDPIGLQIARDGDDIGTLLLALEVTSAVAEEAARSQAQMIFTHHPLIYRPLERIHCEGYAERMVRELIRRNIALFVAHTNLDSAPGGVCDTLAEAIGLRDVQPLKTTRTKHYKLVVFVPPEALDAVSSAMCGAGAGRIGNYTCCTFRVPGTGTFLPGDAADPAAGERGTLNQAEELRLEAVVPGHALADVLPAVRAAHPYEEPAVDVFPLDGGPGEPGLGRLGELEAPVPLSELAAHVKQVLDARVVKFAGDPHKSCRRVAVCGGAGGACLEDAIQAGCDVYVTGELGYHEAIEADERGLAVVAAGHGDSERIVIPKLAAALQEQLEGVEVIASAIRTSPWRKAISYQPSAISQRPE